MSNGQNKMKDKWDKWDIVLKPVGGLITAIAIAVLGIIGSGVLEKKQKIDARTRLYVELMSKREASDTLLRKGMFDLILEQFLKSGKGSDAELENKVLALELLTFNFHEVIDLGPLFKQVYDDIEGSSYPNKEKDKEKEKLSRRLEKLAQEVTGKQVAALEEAGEKIDGMINIQELERSETGVFQAINRELAPLTKIKDCASNIQNMTFIVEVLDADPEKKELHIRLQVFHPCEGQVVDSLFWVGFYDFPMIDNTRLPNEERCAIVLNIFEVATAGITLLYFPGERASLKDKPYYDELIHRLLEENGQ